MYPPPRGPPPMDTYSQRPMNGGSSMLPYDDRHGHHRHHNQRRHPMAGYGGGMMQESPYANGGGQYGPLGAGGYPPLYGNELVGQAAYNFPFNNQLIPGAAAASYPLALQQQMLQLQQLQQQINDGGRTAVENEMLIKAYAALKNEVMAMYATADAGGVYNGFGPLYGRVFQGRGWGRDDPRRYGQPVAYVGHGRDDTKYVCAVM
ncbi:MAG: hypothetical protein M1832_003134 [Thelocarpon impressellum]|nr:MAG: hypothetical protein M1832_003134 [Thelocarpon impressellum]